MKFLCQFGLNPSSGSEDIVQTKSYADADGIHTKNNMSPTPSEGGHNEILMSIKDRNSVKILRKMTGNNPKLDLVNDDVHTNFGWILSIRSQDIERKRNSDVNQGP